MSMPGWYPDPAGTPGRFRYWDGTSWSAETTGDPASAPRPGQQPQAFAGGASGSGGQNSSNRGLLVGIAVVLALALLVWALFFRGDGGFKAVPEDTNSSSPQGPVWDETSPPTPEPSGISEPAPTGGAMVKCPMDSGSVLPIQGDELHGGGLVIPRLGGWDEATRSTFLLPWTENLQAQTKTIYSSPLGTRWFSVQAVGALPVAEGFEEPRNSARMMMSCFATSGYYSGFIGRKDLQSKAVDIDGKKGWHLRSEVYVEMPDLPQVEGDVIDVIVVDTGSPESLGVFVSSATIGDAETLAEIDDSISRMRPE
ncbi:DUF2510 domain-containing protein [Luteococcus sp. Sow4_B9]|uniref:DUF2510 domain-containing protein n=1 Tax=Luteococcus sp. Sow4_B9 TaxID=3438792 RepID=UPI003F96E4D9